MIDVGPTVLDLPDGLIQGDDCMLASIVVKLIGFRKGVPEATCTISLATFEHEEEGADSASNTWSGSDAGPSRTKDSNICDAVKMWASMT